jgi:polyisoprenoid-binding protein YceI
VCSRGPLGTPPHHEDERIGAMSTQATPAALATWTIDPMHNFAQFTVKHMMIATVTGRLGTISGTVRFDGVDLTTGSAEATIDVTALSTGNEMRDNDLKSPNFFDVAQYPTITFRSTRVERVEGDEYKVHGDLTIRGVARPITLDVTYEGQINDPMMGHRAGFSAETTLSRKEFGMTYNPLLETGGAVVGDRVKVSVHFEAVHQG